MNKKFLAGLLSLGLVFTACGSNELGSGETNQAKVEESSSLQKMPGQEKKMIYTSFFPIYNLTKQIAGDKFEVMSLGSLETEAHDREPSAKDLASLNEAEVLIINGAGMEAWKDDVENSTNLEILDTSEGLDLIKTDEDDDDHDHEEDQDYDDHEEEEHEDDHDHEEEGHHHHGLYDPHTWLSPVNGKLQAEKIANKLAELDPVNADYFKANYEKIAKDLDDISKEYKEKFAKVDRHSFVVPHQAFDYICRDFDLEQIPLTGITSTEEPDAKAMEKVIKLAKEENINTIFYEKGGSDKAASVIASEIGGKTSPLSTLEFATKDELEKEVTYQELIKENLEAIYKSLE